MNVPGVLHLGLATLNNGARWVSLWMIHLNSLIIKDLRLVLCQVVIPSMSGTEEMVRLFYSTHLDFCEDYAVIVVHHVKENRFVRPPTSTKLSAN